MIYDPNGRWRHQYRRIADVLQQRVDQLTPPPHAGHETYVRPEGCSICALVDTAPPLTPDQIARLRVLLSPWVNA